MFNHKHLVYHGAMDDNLVSHHEFGKVCKVMITGSGNGRLAMVAFHDFMNIYYNIYYIYIYLEPK